MWKPLCDTDKMSKVFKTVTTVWFICVVISYVSASTVTTNTYARITPFIWQGEFMSVSRARRLLSCALECSSSHDEACLGVSLEAYSGVDCRLHQHMTSEEFLAFRNSTDSIMWINAMGGYLSSLFDKDFFGTCRL